MPSHLSQNFSCVIVSFFFSLLAFHNRVMSEPRVINTAVAARITIDSQQMEFKTGVATIEARPGTPEYSWLRIKLFSFSPTAEDLLEIQRGSTDSMDRKTSQLGSTDAYNRSNATLQLSVGPNSTVWLIDISVPGTSCTVAPNNKAASAVLQKYSFNGTNLQLRSNGSYECDMKFMGIPNKVFTWEINVDLPVFKA